MVHYNAHTTGEYNALYTPTNHGFFIAHMSQQMQVTRGGLSLISELHRVPMPV